MALITQKAYAARIGKSPQYVNKLVRDGVIRLKQGQVDPRQADRALKQRPGSPGQAPAASRRAPAKKRGRPAKAAGKRTRRQSPAAPRQSATGSLTAWRAQTEEFKAKSAKLEYLKMEGTLLPADKVLEAEHRKNANFRTRFLRLPDAVAAPVAALKTPAQVREYLLEEIKALLAQFAADPLAEAVSHQPSAISVPEEVSEFQGGKVSESEANETPETLKPSETLKPAETLKPSDLETSASLQTPAVPEAPADAAAAGGVA